MNGAPDWQDGECCFRCRTQFTLVARKHHCRNCGNIFCAKCSSQQIPLPKLNIEKNVRVCDTCYEKITNKNEDPLTLALDSNSSKEQTKSRSTNSKSSSSSKQVANTASAPSEQELKEEEELQLALALSLSETPTKVSFPDCRHFETSSSNSSSSQANKPTSSKASTISTSSNNVVQSNINGNSPQRASTQSEIITPAVNSVDYYAALNNSTSVVQQSQPMQLHYPAPQPVQAPQPDYQIPDRDLEVYRYVGEVQSTLEIFNNRLESCKLRNRPVANDAAIQSTFLKLNTELQPKLAEYIKIYEEERANYERLQDKLSQIADARAALDALREEYQEKVRQQAAEAERLRQSQLATKLEAMRQKKSEMMQYQRELALQRIREHEMMLQQQQPASAANYQGPSTTVPSQLMSSNSAFDPMQQMHDPSNSAMPNQQVLASHSQAWHQPTISQQYTPTHVNYVPDQQNLHQYQNQHTASQPPTQATQPYGSLPPPPPAIDRASLAQLERQFLPNSKPEEDAPLISFDD